MPVVRRNSSSHAFQTIGKPLFSELVLAFQLFGAPVDDRAMIITSGTLSVLDFGSTTPDCSVFRPRRNYMLCTFTVTFALKMEAKGVSVGIVLLALIAAERAPSIIGVNSHVAAWPSMIELLVATDGVPPWAIGIVAWLRSELVNSDTMLDSLRAEGLVADDNT